MNDKPHEFLDKYRRAAGGGYGRGLVPLLEHDDALVIESDAVTKYVARNVQGVNGQGDALYPDTEEEEVVVERFLHEWDRVTDAYYGVLTASSQPQAERRQASFLQSLGTIDKLLQQGKGDGAFLLADFSYGECIAAPWVQRMYVTLPYFRGIDFTEDILSRPDLVYVSTWMESVCDRPSCRGSRCPAEEMIAAGKRYYVSFVSPGASGSL